MKRNSNFFKQGLEVEQIKEHIAKSIVSDMNEFIKKTSDELSKKLEDNIEEK